MPTYSKKKKQQKTYFWYYCQFTAGLSIPAEYLKGCLVSWLPSLVGTYNYRLTMLKAINSAPWNSSQSDGNLEQTMTNADQGFSGFSSWPQVTRVRSFMMTLWQVIFW